MAATDKTADKAKAEVEKKVSKELEQGFRGLEVDPTPNEHYTVPGVLAGKPTPENDPDHAREVRSQLDSARRI